MLEHALSRLMEFAQIGLLASIGAMAKYLRENMIEDRQFSWSLFIVNIIVAFCVGNMVGAFIKETSEFREGLIMVAGYCAYPLLGIIEDRFLAMVKNKTP